MELAIRVFAINWVMIFIEAGNTTRWNWKLEKYGENNINWVEQKNMKIKLLKCTK